MLERERLMEQFVAIVAAEDTPVSKPSPEPYLCALARLTSSRAVEIAARECVAIEDSPWGLQSARAAGMRTVAVAHSYDASKLHFADLVINEINCLDLDQLAHLFDF